MQETQEMLVRFLGPEDPLEESMATHSSVLAWEIQGTKEPGGLQSTGLQGLGHCWRALARMHRSEMMSLGGWIIGGFHFHDERHSSVGHVQLFAILWTAACQAPLSMGLSRQEYWSGLPCSPPGDLPDPGVEPASLMSPPLAGRFFTTSATWETHLVPRD